MVLGIVGERGVAVYPGQSAEEVLKIAAIIQDETDGDIDHYKARDIAREILRAQGGRRS
jgi:hypothetical protein